MDVPFSQKNRWKVRLLRHVALKMMILIDWLCVIVNVDLTSVSAQFLRRREFILFSFFTGPL